FLIASGAKTRKVLPVESIQAILEVRSTINKKAFEDADEKVKELSKLKRQYTPTFLHRIVPPQKENRDKWKDGIAATDYFGNLVYPVMSALIGFGGLTPKKAIEHIEKLEQPSISVVVQIGSYVSWFNRIENQYHTVGWGDMS